MRTLVRRLTTLVVAMLALAPSLAQGAVPAAAAGVVYYVDDTPANNGSVACSGPFMFTNIQDAFNAVTTANTTIYVCPGDYNQPAAVLGSTNLKLIAKGNVFLTPNGSFTGDFLLFNNSANFTIQGFIIDGTNQLGGNANAIAIYESTGSIVKNTITRWREPNQAATTGTAIGIMVDNFGGNPANKVKIDHNTIYQFQNFGIEVTSMNGVAITHNYLQWTANGNYTPWGIHLNYGSSGSISGNTLQSNYSSGNTSGTFGIVLTETTKIKLSANKISMVNTGIYVRDFCDITNASNNTISGNTITDTDKGVYIFGSYLTCLSATQGNIISGNKFMQHFVPTVAIELNGDSNAVIKDTIIKSNTYTGYLNTDPTDMTGTVTGLAETKNKSIFLLPPGA